ncbi:uncharacterized protein DS421_11g340670 [Arachis hypogaea]|nr:uncharacterized protein DS421_11g340670 [Arachis hypogaea]
MFSGLKIELKQPRNRSQRFSAFSARGACDASASSTRSRHLCRFQSTRSHQARNRIIAISSIPCGRVSHASASVFAGHLLGFFSFSAETSSNPSECYLK